MRPPSLPFAPLLLTIPFGCGDYSSAPSPTPIPVCSPRGDATITEATLFEEMVDPLRLAHQPRVPWTSHLASSYDRRSTDPALPSWFANQDATGFEASEGAEQVMLDVDGPGAIVRIGSANPNGTLRIYLDGASTPIVQAEMADFLAGSVSPFSPPFAFRVANGANLVYPIPFASHLKVTTTATSLYYNIDYRKYPAGAPVVSFTGNAPLGGSERRAAEVVLGGARPSPLGSEVTLALDSSTKTPVTMTAPEGGGVISSLALDVDRIDADALRKTVAVLTFDGEVTVQAPLGDLFAFEPAGTDVDSLPVAGHHDGRFVLRFPMPFASVAGIELVDVGAGPVRATGTAHLEAAPFDEGSFHFHAHWTGIEQLDAFAPSLFRVASIAGSGIYVGTVLHVGNPHPSWWGEGDEQIWVDGGDFPAHFGTGTEDYFGYAYCTTERFSHAYLGQTRANARNFAGFISLYRFHFADAIPFQRSLVFDLEVQHWEQGRTHPSLSYDAVYYFYARPGAVVDNGVRAPSDFVLPTLPDGVEVTGSESTRC